MVPTTGFNLNASISLQTSNASSNHTFCAYPPTIEFQETTSLLSISSRTRRASIRQPHFPYIATRPFLIKKIQIKSKFNNSTMNFNPTFKLSKPEHAYNTQGYIKLSGSNPWLAMVLKTEHHGTYGCLHSF